MTTNGLAESLPPLKTWSRLAGARRRPTEYEVVTVGLLMNRGHDRWPGAAATELDPSLPINEWYRHNREARLKHHDWDAFRDPDELTYRSYTTLQHAQEIYVEGLLEEFSSLEHDRTLADTWLEALGVLYAPTRFLFHAQQMASAYLGMLSPASTIATCFGFQVGDAMRLVSHVAYRTVELDRTWPEAALIEAGRRNWESHPAWQGLRELMERVLVAYEWSEGIVALNLIAKPICDELLLRELSVSARRNGDDLLGLVNDAHLRDSERSRRWTSALVQHIAAGADGNLELLADHVASWLPLGHQAIDAFCEFLPDHNQAAGAVRQRLAQLHETTLAATQPTV